MKKIPTLFVRNGRHVIDEVTPGCEWVRDGAGMATEKLDGTNVRLTVRSGEVVRVEARRNPSKFQKSAGILEPWYRDAEPAGDKWILVAVELTDVSEWPDGEHCCEALGPKIQGNPLGLETHVCVAFELSDSPVLAICVGFASREFGRMAAAMPFLKSVYSPGHLAEGIVFHHPDGRRAKIKRKDFA